VLDHAKGLAEEGFAVHWLHPKSKRPRGNDWSERPVASVADLERTYRDGFNVGIRLGEPSKVCGFYAHVLDIDIRDPAAEEEALSALDELLPDWESFPQVKSGSGGPSIHIYFFTDTAFRSKKLRHSAEKFEDAEGKKHWRWEIELFGTGKQVACPPSIHPDTDKPYRWLKEVDFDKLDRGLSQIVDDDVVESWGGAKGGEEESRSSTRDDDSPPDGDADDFTNYVRSKRKGDISYEDAEGFLRDLDHDEWCFDYEGWLKVGMALHHEFGGDDMEALEIWHEFSRAADNYDADALDDKWKSFGKDKRRRPVSFGTIIAAGTLNRNKKEISGAETNEDLKHSTGSEENDDLDWVRLLTTNDKGGFKSCPHNVEVILRFDPRLRGIIGFNAFTQRLVLRKRPAKKVLKREDRQWRVKQLDSPIWRIDADDAVHGKPISDDHISDLRTVLTAAKGDGGYDFGITKQDLNDALVRLGHDQEFHPVLDYLEGLTWDGVPRLETMLIDWLGAEDTPYTRQVSTIFPVAAIARVFTPGIKFDCAPILEGAQGIGKSTFIRLLAKNWFVELNCGFEDPKRIVETLAGHWIAELPELSQFGKSDVETVKAFFSASKDTVRLAYGHHAETHKRQSVYMGSTNNDQYLRDESGNRRFWPIKCSVKRIDLEGFAAVVDQIWAEALTRYDEMVDAAGSKWSIFLDLTGAAATDAALQIQESRRVETEADTWAGMIEAWLDTPVRLSDLEGRGEHFDDEDGGDKLVRRANFCAFEVWVDALGGHTDNWGRGNQTKVMSAIRKVPGVIDAGILKHRKYGKQRHFKREWVRRSKADLLG